MSDLSQWDPSMIPPVPDADISQSPVDELRTGAGAIPNEDEDFPSEAAPQGGSQPWADAAPEGSALEGPVGSHPETPEQTPEQTPGQDQSQQQPPQMALAYLQGHGAMPYEQVQQLEQQADPQGQLDEGTRHLVVMANLTDQNQRLAYLQHMRKNFDAYKGAAAAADEGGKPDQAAHYATKAINKLPDGVNIQFQPIQGGYLAAATDGESGKSLGKARLTSQQFQSVTHGMQFDHALRDGAMSVFQHHANRAGQGGDGVVVHDGSAKINSDHYYNTPGPPGSRMSGFDGPELAQRAQGGREPIDGKSYPPPGARDAVTGDPLAQRSTAGGNATNPNATTYPSGGNQPAGPALKPWRADWEKDFDPAQVRAAKAFSSNPAKQIEYLTQQQSEGAERESKEKQASMRGDAMRDVAGIRGQTSLQGIDKRNEGAGVREASREKAAMDRTLVKLQGDQTMRANSNNIGLLRTLAANPQIDAEELDNMAKKLIGRSIRDVTSENDQMGRQPPQQTGPAPGAAQVPRTTPTQIQQNPQQGRWGTTQDGRRVWVPNAAQ